MTSPRATCSCFGDGSQLEEAWVIPQAAEVVFWGVGAWPPNMACPRKNNNRRREIFQREPGLGFGLDGYQATESPHCSAQSTAVQIVRFFAFSVFCCPLFCPFLANLGSLRVFQLRNKSGAGSLHQPENRNTKETLHE